jgi:hypothetical protein
MAKPLTSFTFATNANYSVGPESGNPSKVVPGDTANGFVPGDGVPAAWNNYLFNITGGWSVWLLAGTYDPDEDAHLVETDSDGFASLAQLTLGGTAAALQALIVTQNTGAQSAAGVFSNTGTGFALTGTASSTVAGIRGTNTGTGAGVEGLALGTDNHGVKGTGTGAGTGGFFTGGATGPGVTCSGGATGDYGALCTGTGAFAGVSATGGSTAGEAVLGTGSWNEQAGIRGTTHAAALTTTAGVVGAGLGAAAGVRSTAETGYGIIAQSDTTAPVRSAFRVVPQNADPTTPLMGDVTHRSDIDIPRVYTDSLWQSPWTTASGHTHGLAAPRTTNATNADSTTYVSLVTCNLAGPYEPRFAGGSVLLFASARFGDINSAGGFHHYLIDVQILDVTAGVAVYEQTINTGPAVPDAAIDNLAVSQWTIIIPYTIPLAGAREFQLRFKPDVTLPAGAVANVASLNVIGVFG